MNFKASVKDVRRWFVEQLKKVLAVRPGPRRYIQPGMSVANFFQSLNAANVHYVVLRWVEHLPHVLPGEDIDLLVSDHDLDKLHQFTIAYRGIRRVQKIDVYTASGLPGSDFNGTPYFSQLLASRLLKNARPHKSGAYVPFKVDYFDSLAFHALYHKGLHSGLPAHSGAVIGIAPRDHDYVAALRQLRDDAGKNVAITLDSLHRYLHSNQLSPPLDTLQRFAEKNSWLYQRLEEMKPQLGIMNHIVVFVVRDRAAPLAYEIQSYLDTCGFECLATIRFKQLTPQEQNRVRNNIRGGNWNRGPFPISGGDPAVFIVALNCKAAHPICTNNHYDSVVDLKARLRQSISETVNPSERFNGLHSSDNGWQSQDYLESIGGSSLIEKIKERARVVTQSMEPPWPSTDTMRCDADAITHKIVHPDHGVCQLKIVRPGARQHIACEKLARQVLGNDSLMPPLLEVGENWILIPHYSDTQQHIRRQLPAGAGAQLTLRASRALALFLKRLRSHGAYLAPLVTDDIISDQYGDLKIINWSCFNLYTPGQRPSSLKFDYTVVGSVPHHHENETSLVFGKSNLATKSDAACVFEKAVCGADVNALLHASGAVLAVKVTLGHAFYYTVLLVRKWLDRVSGTKTMDLITQGKRLLLKRIVNPR